MDFAKYYFDEKKMYINLDDKPSGQTLGVVDDDKEIDPHYEKKINRIKSQLNLEEIKECLRILMEGKNLSKYENDFIAVFTKYVTNQNNLKKLAQAVKGENSFDYSKDFLVKDMYEYYNKLAPKVVHSKFYTAMYNLIPAGASAAQLGRGELLLALMTKLDKKLKRVDLVDVDGTSVELKANTAKFKGGENPEAVYGPEVIKNISKLIGEEIKDKTVNLSVLSKLFDYLQKNKKLAPKIIPILRNYKNIPLPDEAIDEFNKINRVQDFCNLALAIHAYSYIKTENINKIFFIKGFTVEDLKVKIFVFKSFKNLYNFIKSNLKFLGNWSGAKAGFDFAVL